MSRKTVTEKNIYEIYTRNTFVKIKPAFEIGKILFSFVETNNKKESIKNIDCYLSVADSALLANKITTGRMRGLIAKEKQKGEQYPKDVWISPLGGINEKTAKEKKLRNDGRAISRHFTLAPGASQYAVLTAKQGAGTTNEKGLIVPDNSDENRVVIRVAVTSHDVLEEMALMIQAAVNAYMFKKLFGEENGAPAQSRQTTTTEENKEPTQEQVAEDTYEVPPVVWPEDWK